MNKCPLQRTTLSNRMHVKCMTRACLLVRMCKWSEVWWFKSFFYGLAEEF